MVRCGWGLLAPLAFVLGVLGGCEMVPRFLEESHQVDQYLVRGQFRSACVGLEAEADTLREYTARKLAAYPDEALVGACVCSALYDAKKGRYDAAVAKGLAASRRGDFASCLAPALADDRIADRTGVTRALAGIAAPESYAALAARVPGEPDVAVRAAMVAALQPSEAHVPLLLERLQSDPDPGVRTAAAGALHGRDASEIVDAMIRVAAEDADGGVRAAALAAAVKGKRERTDALVCKAMLQDPDDAVRLAAVRAVHGTKRPEVLRCLVQRLRTKEESSAVRSATLKALGASPSEEAAKVLCDQIGPFLRMYVVDQIAERMSGVNIVEVQNDRDWERSYACVQKALGQGGYSCYARNHLAGWFKELGGNAHQPLCPGME